MLVSYEKIVASEPCLQNLVKIKFKGSIQTHLLRNLRLVIDEMKTFNELKLGLLQQYAKKNETGQLAPDEKGMVEIEVGALNDFNNAMRLILDQQIEIPLTTIQVELFQEYEIEPANLLPLCGWMLEENLNVN